MAGWRRADRVGEGSLDPSSIWLGVRGRLWLGRKAVEVAVAEATMSGRGLGWRVSGRRKIGAEGSES